MSRQIDLRRQGLLPRWVWFTTLAVVASPLVVIMLLGFVRIELGQIAGLSLEGYAELFKSYRIGEVGLVSLRSLVLGGLASFVGFTVAFVLVRHFSIRWQNIFLLLLTLPFLINEAVKTFAWTNLLQRGGTFNYLAELIGLSDTTFTLASIWNVYAIILLNLIPFAVFISTLTLRNIDANIWLAAEEMGARSSTIFWHIGLPLGKFGLFFSWLVTAFFGLSMTTEVNFLGGVSKLSIPNLISNLQSSNNLPAVFSLGTLFLLIALGSFFILRTTIRR